MNIRLYLCLMFSLLLLIGCANQDYEEEENLDRIGNTLVLDGVCSKEINQCAPGNPILYDEPCEHFCDVCWYCEGINSNKGEFCKVNICGGTTGGG